MLHTLQIYMPLYCIYISVLNLWCIIYAILIRVIPRLSTHFPSTFWQCYGSHFACGIVTFEQLPEGAYKVSIEIGLRGRATRGSRGQNDSWRWDQRLARYIYKETKELKQRASNRSWRIITGIAIAFLHFAQALTPFWIVCLSTNKEGIWQSTQALCFPKKSPKSSVVHLYSRAICLKRTK